MTDSEASELEQLRAENAALKAKGARVKDLSFKVSEKGAVSVYGLQRFPVTLYKEQWSRILDKGEELRAFIEANEKSLAVRE